MLKQLFTLLFLAISLPFSTSEFIIPSLYSGYRPTGGGLLPPSNGHLPLVSLRFTVQDGSTVNCIFLTLTNYVYPMQSVPATCSSTSGDVWKWYLTSYTNAGQFTLYISHTNGGVVHQSTGIISYADTQARGATYSCDAAGSCTYEFDNAGDPIRIGFS